MSHTASRRGAAIGGPGGVLSEDEVRAFVREQLAGGRRRPSVCVLVPDGTRSCPLPLVLPAVHGALHGHVSRLTVLVALGTHARMSEAARRASRLRGRRLADALSGRRPSSTTSGGTRPPSRSWGASTPSGSPSCPRAAARERRRPGQPGARRARRHDHRRPGVPARGRRLLRRQQVPVPGRLRARS